MSERDEGPRRPMSTGEFRAAPDPAASTQQFRAFVGGQPADTEAPWDMKAPGRNIARLAVIIVLVAVVLAVVAIIVVKM